jgi:hypothetical protein
MLSPIDRETGNDHEALTPDDLLKIHAGISFPGEFPTPGGFPGIPPQLPPWWVDFVIRQISPRNPQSSFFYI